MLNFEKAYLKQWLLDKKLSQYTATRPHIYCRTVSERIFPIKNFKSIIKLPIFKLLRDKNWLLANTLQIATH